jgi:cytochrome P450
LGQRNRDPKALSNPDEFLDSDRRNDVAFGMGTHHFLGGPLARAEANVTLNAFLCRGQPRATSDTIGKQIGLTNG